MKATTFACGFEPQLSLSEFRETALENPLPRAHRFCCWQIPEPHGSREFNPESATSAIKTNAANLNVLHRLTFDVQRFDAVDTIANPFPALDGRSSGSMD